MTEPDRSMKILYMGTPEFAVPSLRALVAAGHEVIGCVTREDAPKGRKMVLTPPPVKVAATELGIPVYQPHTLRDEAFAALLAALDPAMICVVAYGKILPKNVLDYPKYGCINVHGSLLPAYRGAAPMQRVLMDGAPETGITTMYMDEGMDTGDMLLVEKHPLAENETYGEMADALAAIGAKLLVETVALAAAGKLVRHPQDHGKATVAPKIGKEEEELDFTLPAAVLHNRCRALSPAPMCRAYLPNGSLLKIAGSALVHEKATAAPGTVLCDDGRLTVVCGDGERIEFTFVVPEGKQKMAAADYLRGRRVATGDILTGRKG